MPVAHASAADEYVFDRIEQFALERIVQHGGFVGGENYFLESHTNVLGHSELQNVRGRHVRTVESFQQIDVDLPNGRHSDFRIRSALYTHTSGRETIGTENRQERRVTGDFVRYLRA